MQSKLIVKIVFLFLSVIASLYYAFYNKYPLFFPDTFGYIQYAFEGFSIDKPSTYSYLIRWITGASSLWNLIILQAVMMVIVLYRIIKLFQIREAAFLTFSCTLVLSFVTGYSTYVSQLMPDVFTSITILSVILIFLESPKSVYYWVTCSVFTVAAMTHLTHIFICICVLVIISLVYLLKAAFINKIIFKRNLIIAWLVVVCAWILVPTLNYVKSGSFFISKTSHAFFMARLAENGILDKYLDEHCHKEKLKLCEFRYQIPRTSSEFLWDANSPIYKTDGWLDKDNEYKKIIGNTFKKYPYLLLHIQESVKSTFAQLFNFDNGDGMNQFGLTYEIQNHYRYESKSYLNSRQNLGHLNFRFLNQLQYLSVSFFLFIVLLFLFDKRLNKVLDAKQNFIISIIFLALLLNAFFAGALSGAYWRYQGRVIWMIPFLGMVLLFTQYNVIKNYILDLIRLNNTSSSFKTADPSDE